MIIIFKNADGTCGVIHPAHKALKTVENPTGFTIEEIAEKDVPDGLEYRLAPLESLPKERYYRDAWTDDLETETVDVDIEKARVIHSGKIREARNAKLAELDIETMKGLDVQAEKQVLRDLPANTDLSTATTPEELRAIWPEVLK